MQKRNQVLSIYCMYCTNDSVQRFDTNMPKLISVNPHTLADIK